MKLGKTIQELVSYIFRQSLYIFFNIKHSYKTAGATFTTRRKNSPPVTYGNTPNVLLIKLVELKSLDTCSNSSNNNIIYHGLSINYLNLRKQRFVLHDCFITRHAVM